MQTKHRKAHLQSFADITLPAVKCTVAEMLDTIDGDTYKVYGT